MFSDIDECTRDEHDCNQLCINTVGSYECMCRDGYFLHQDGKTCLGKLQKVLFQRYLHWKLEANCGQPFMWSPV